ncbi:hypothetical protein CO123_01520 [bacterium (Candidatus Howlettbacteria) CG_4_9_14_3_um_filter_37_10]|nr:MAG: hypothetical protein CO123_01520 [bacterium (Candidatus Howlettbacteria) CG_4_9_14_3_um_filter_37_10]
MKDGAVSSATGALVKPIAEMIPPLLIFFGVFYLINFAFLVFYLKYTKNKISWPAVCSIIGASAAMTFVSLLVASFLFDNYIFIFLVTFVIISLTDFLGSKFILKLSNKDTAIISLSLPIIANPLAWMMILL